MFADDLILFCKADPATLQHIMNVLHDFHKCDGLQANIQKSQMVLGGVHRNCKVNANRLQGCKIATSDSSTWGCPLHQAINKGGMQKSSGENYYKDENLGHKKSFICRQGSAH